MTTLTRSDIAEILQKNIGEFLSQLEQTFPEEDDLLMIKLIIQQVPVDLLIEQFNKYVIPYRKMILQQDEEFFLKDTNVFSKIQDKKGSVNHFKQLWISEEMNKETRSAIWKWFEKFVKIVDRFNSME